MLSLTRTAAKRGPRPLIRSFSEALNAEPHPEPPPPPPTSAGPSRGRRPANRRSDYTALSHEKVPVPQDHGLYAFFRKKQDGPRGEARYEVVETPQDAQMHSGKPIATRQLERIYDMEY